jgi:hypothetical protein
MARKNKTIKFYSDEEKDIIKKAVEKNNYPSALAGARDLAPKLNRPEGGLALVVARMMKKIGHPTAKNKSRAMSKKAIEPDSRKLNSKKANLPKKNQLSFPLNSVDFEIKNGRIWISF